MRNVSRAWAYETGLATGVELGRGRCMPMTDRNVLILLQIYPSTNIMNTLARIIS